jgi:hypothetical protein
MRGTVTTYELNTPAVADMVEGHLMPEAPAILASLISITFITKGMHTKNWMHNTFRVRRQSVRRALLWLKTHNPKYYSQIEVSEARLQELPDDDVPLEIQSIICETTDTSMVEAETTGYVRETEDNGIRFHPNPYK